VKRVRYLAGAVGLAPLAFAAAAAPTAPRVPSGPVAANENAKTVSLHHVGHRADCTGHIKVVTPSSNAPSYERLFYTREPNSKWCIGTVFYFESGVASGGHDMRTRIYAPLGHRAYQHYNGGTISTLHNGISFTNRVRRSFGPTAHVQVCVAMVEAAHKSHVSKGPICTTVPH
jgi:hypothetical protein